MMYPDWDFTIERSVPGWYWELCPPIDSKIRTSYSGVTFTRKGAVRRMRRIKNRENNRVNTKISGSI